MRKRGKYYMASKCTEEERKRVDEKFNNPTKKVLCPRCGKELEFTQRGSSCQVRCPSEDCIVVTIRGI